MSFFFTKAKARDKRPSAVTGRPFSAGYRCGNTSQNATLNRFGCNACPLNRADVVTPKMLPTLAKHTKIYFLAEAPGRDEDENTGQPLTGPSGSLLRECIPDGEEEFCSFDNVVNCRPQDNRTPTGVEIECCRPRRWKWVEEAKPLLIVGLGVIPLSMMLGKTDMVGMRGRMFAVKVGKHACWFMPTYHPSFILRMAFKKDRPFQSKFGHCFRQDVKRAFDSVENLPNPHIDSEADVRSNIQTFDGTVDYFHKVKELLTQAIEAPVKAIDLETKGLRPYRADAAIMTVAISFGSTNFSFALDHPKSGWTKPQRVKLLSLLRQLIEDGTVKVAHNAPFELEWLIWLFADPKIVRHTAWHCTQMQAQFIDERRGKQYGEDDRHRSAYQSLDFLVKQYFGIAYKSLFKLDKKDMSKADLGETLIYNAADTKYTLRLHHLQKRLLEERSLWWPYLEALPRQPTVALMQWFGIGADQAEVKRIQGVLEGGIKGILEEINLQKVVKTYIKDNKEFNPQGQDVIKIFKDYLKCPEVAIKDGGKVRYSTDKSVLQQIKHPLAQLILDLRNKCKLKSTYVDCLEMGKGEAIYPDGLIHCNFNTTFAETGRTSCVAHWTPISTKRGVVPIRDVVIGDEVLTHNNRWKKVTKLWRKGWAPMFNIHLSNGQVLTCTKIHRLLRSDGQWVAAGEIYGLFKEVGKKSSQCGCSFGGISQQKNEICGANSTGIKYSGQQCVVDYEELSKQGGTQIPEDVEILSLKAGRQESDEGQVLRTTSKMERGVQRREWLFDNFAQRQTNFRASFGDDAKPAAEFNPRWMGSTPHRHKQNQQSSRQLSFSNPQRASGYSLKGASGFEVIKIEKIEISGSYEVFDFTVNEDASYESCGVFSHNSDEPNMQNFPQRKDSWVRKQVTAPKDYVIVAFDYGQLEACTAAMCSKDKVLVKALWEDYDIHMEWAIKLAKKYPAIIGGKTSLDDKDKMKKFRSLVKNKLVFPAIFGAATTSVHGYLMNATGVEMPDRVVEELMDEFWETFSGLYSWQQALLKIYYETGYVDSPTGRRHRYPLTRSQVINHPVQSLACDIVCDAMNRLSFKATEEQVWHLHPRLNIHDDLTFIIPDDDLVLEESIEIIYRIMLTPPYECINVPLSVTCSVGKNWYGIQPDGSNPDGMAEIGKFWSHKDL